ncbi:DUF5687 family protein [Flavobacterium sp. XGLA_31]|uniref:DUF5687 family protein n=1 Tax=Flavobacterium sp. XGLA_31 TaxID=3447666 RepID=UPI003F2ECF85
MFKHFIWLEWKSFFRSASFATNLVLKILMGLMALYFIAIFTVMGIALFFLIKEDYHLDPLATLNKFLIYYLVGDLVIRYFFQQMPVTNIKPLLTLPIKRDTIVHYTLGKSVISFFNVIHAFFFIPFTVVLLLNGYGFQAILWLLGIWALIYVNNFTTVLINNKNSVFYPLLLVVVGLGVAQYYQYFDVTVYTQPFFQLLYSTVYGFLIAVIVAAVLYYATFRYFKNNLNLDTGLAKKSQEAKTENLTWLNQFGTLGTFLKNDIRLIKRNKRPRGTLIASIVFIFYGLFFFTNIIEVYNTPAMQVFGGIFVSGGFLLNFGQFVPSWDSAYYQLMMSQNISYRQYLSSKWWLMVIATVVSTLIASFYLYFGWKVYLLIVVGAIYNIGVNSHLVLLGGAYNKTAIDLTASKAFGQKQAFSFKNLLIAVPKILVPMLLYALGYFIFSPEIGCLMVALAGVLGFAFKDKVFSLIEKIYKNEKYATIAAYKQKN